MGRQTRHAGISDVKKRYIASPSIGTLIFDGSCQVSVYVIQFCIMPDQQTPDRLRTSWAMGRQARHAGISDANITDIMHQNQLVPHISLRWTIISKGIPTFYTLVSIWCEPTESYILTIECSVTFDIRRIFKGYSKDIRENSSFITTAQRQDK